jgi:tripartite-type tricarboxylate transporter receptor subunit TctC
MADDVVRTINQDVSDVLGLPDVANRMKDMAMITVKGDAPAFAQLLTTDARRYKKLVEDFRIRPD